jgi:hypothetical protein
MSQRRPSHCRQSSPARPSAPTAAPDWHNRAAACRPSRGNSDLAREPGCAPPDRSRPGNSFPAPRPELIVALDVEIGMRLDPRMIERRMVGHEIEHEPQAAGGEPGCGMRPAPPSRPAPHRPRRRRWRSPSRRCPLPSDRAARPGTRPARRVAARHGPAGRACPPDAQEPDPVEAAAREVIQGGVVDVGESDRLPASCDRRHSQTLVLISYSEG